MGEVEQPGFTNDNLGKNALSFDTQGGFEDNTEAISSFAYISTLVKDICLPLITSAT